MSYSNQKSLFFTLTCLCGLVLVFLAPGVSKALELEMKPSFVAEAQLQPCLHSGTTHRFPFLPQESSTVPNYSLSKRKAIFMSLLVPGWGEHFAGRKQRARSFFITELFLWSSYAGFKIYENWIEDEFKVFAETHAQAQPEGKIHKYFVNIGNYDNIYEYNASKLNYRLLDEVYPETAENYWQWDSPANKHDFKMMRIRADNTNYRALFMLGMILVNHVVSAVDAVWVTRTHDVSESQNPLQFHLSTEFDSHEYRLVLCRRF